MDPTGVFPPPDTTPSPAPPSRFRQRLQRHPWVMLAVVLVLVFVAMVLPTPWIFHIGDRFTPTMSWSGYGTVTASNGGRYVLYVDFRGGIFEEGRNSGCSQFGCDSLNGQAKLCSSGGTVNAYAVTGAVHTWWSTDGARTTIEMTGGSPTKLPDGWVIAFAGNWHGSNLVLASPDNSFTEVFTPTGATRTTTSTADMGTASVTLANGSQTAFTQACHLLH
jgi:hypothetical protein